VYIFGICRSTLLIWTLLLLVHGPYYHWTHGNKKIQKFTIVQWTFVDSCFWKKVSHHKIPTPTHHVLTNVWMLWQPCFYITFYVISLLAFTKWICWFKKLHFCKNYVLYFFYNNLYITLSIMTLESYSIFSYYKELNKNIWIFPSKKLPKCLFLFGMISSIRIFICILITQHVANYN
jgi:hypothetical protein